jgi:hypothetical protein
MCTHTNVLEGYVIVSFGVAKKKHQMRVTVRWVAQTKHEHLLEQRTA